MATSQACVSISGEAGSAVTRYRLVSRAADDQYDHVADATVLPNGVAAESVSAVGGELGIVIPNGAVVKMEAGAAISQGAKLEAAGDGTGRVITHTSTLGDYTVGVALNAAGAAGEIIEVQFLVDQDQVA